MSKVRFHRFVTRIEPAVWAVITAGFILLGLEVCSHWTWRTKVQTYVPLLDSVMEARLALATGHLRLDELIAGDETIRPDDFRSLFRQASRAVDDCIGGRRSIATLKATPLADRELLDRLHDLKGRIERLRAIAGDRWQQMETSGRATLTDRAFDSAFVEAQDRGDALEHLVHRKIAEMMGQQGGLLALHVALGFTLVGAACGGLQHTGRKRRSLERELARARAELEGVSPPGMMGQLASGLAHELSQPLTAITNHCGACLMRLSSAAREDERLVANLNQIARQARLAGEVIRRVREFVRPQDSRRAMQDVNQIVRESLASFQHQIANQDVKVDLALAQLPVIAWVDGVAIGQVIVNLIRNALEAMQDTPASQRRLVLSTTVYPGREVEVAVTDHGPGISAEATDRMFEVFYTTKPEGMGLGLAISRAIVEAHGGRLRASSGVAGATTFTFNLPMSSGRDANGS